MRHTLSIRTRVAGDVGAIGGFAGVPAEVQSLEQELGKNYLTEVMVTPQSTTMVQGTRAH